MITVMIVDDQAETRLGFSLMLQRDPEIAVVLEAENGQQAIDRIERAQRAGIAVPDVVLMDVRMPVMDGIDATAGIVARWPSAHVLVLTTYDEDDYAFGALDAGAAGFLLKDVHARDLRCAVRAVAAGDAVLTPRITRALTDREREICALVADGLSNAEIAERLCIQPASAKRAVTRILAKLDLRDRVQIAVMWYRAGMDE